MKNPPSRHLRTCAISWQPIPARPSVRHSSEYETMSDTVVAKRLEISGVVQGVGFRPFLFGLAHAHGLTGQV
ncbi:MAG: acylphosphatase, partial [Proteobacteria bacterium]|nr:acylphosphatase [Pseudomonadota bacterium]